MRMSQELIYKDGSRWSDILAWLRGSGQNISVPPTIDISNHLYWVWDGVKDWSINWTFIWFWHYYNWCCVAPNVICARTLRCARLFLSADGSEVNLVRSIQNNTVFWWVPKLKLKPSSYLHNTLPLIIQPDCEHEQNVMRVEGGGGFGDNKPGGCVRPMSPSITRFSPHRVRCPTHRACISSPCWTQRQTHSISLFSCIH